VAEVAGAHAYLIDNVSEIQRGWLEGVDVVGITAGASAPENLVQDVVACFQEMGGEEFEDVEATTEKVAFALPSISFQEFARNAANR